MKKRIFKYETTQFDYDFINHIKSVRKQKKISQDRLSILMGLAKSFVGNVESHTQVHKYATRHIPLLTHALGFDKISDIMNFPLPEFDEIVVTIEQVIKDDEEKERVLSSKVIKIEELKK